jgi:hypothetical protein
LSSHCLVSSGTITTPAAAAASRCGGSGPAARCPAAVCVFLRDYGCRLPAPRVPRHLPTPRSHAACDLRPLFTAATLRGRVVVGARRHGFPRDGADVVLRLRPRRWLDRCWRALVLFLVRRTLSLFSCARLPTPWPPWYRGLMFVDRCSQLYL